MSRYNKFLIHIAIVLIIILSGVIFFLYNKNRKLEAKNKIIIQALILSNQLNQNSATAYKTFGECVTQPYTCNKQEVEKKLKELETEKEQINSQIQKITDYLNNN